MAKTRTKVVHVSKKVLQHVNVRVAAGRPVRRSKGVIGPSLEAQRNLEVEAVLAVVARIDTEVVQKIAAKPGALHQVPAETESKVVASQPSVISQKVVL